MKIRGVGWAGSVAFVLVLLPSLIAAGEVRVMTSGGFEAPFLALVGPFERMIGYRIVLVTTSMGIGADWIPMRIRCGDAVDVVVLSDLVFSELVSEGLIAADSRTSLVCSAIAMAVRKNA